MSPRGHPEPRTVVSLLSHDARLNLYVQTESDAPDFVNGLLEDEVARLTIDDDVTRKAGIYAYLLTGEERHLSIRAFTPAMKQRAFEIQKGVCKVCAKAFGIADMEADHITPWAEGGKTIPENCQMLCKDCNRRKSNK